MALPELVKLSVEKKLGDYCLKKVPSQYAHEMRVGYHLRGDTVTLFESHPRYDDPSQWVEIPVAQFRFDGQTALWSLYWPDRNSRWHRHDDVAPSKKFDDLLKAVERDRTGIFWG